MNYIQPAQRAFSFHCPHSDCQTHSEHAWLQENANYTFMRTQTGHPILQIQLANLDMSVGRCLLCNQIHIWYGGKLLYPASSNTPSANPDMPAAVVALYTEAQQVLPHSPRASCALLRLALEKLLTDMGFTGDLNAKIGTLVAQGMSPMVQQTLDSVRVIGNRAVHPGQIDSDDTEEFARIQFRLLNYIVEELITKPKEIQAVYDSLPEGVRTGITNRDNRP